MKRLTLILALLLVFLQFELWIGTGSLTEVHHLEQLRAELKAEAHRLEERNESLTAEVMDLKHGQEALEERARSELGMIQPDEFFYQIVDQRDLSELQRD